MNSSRPLSWLIVEDSLESRTGHWFEYLDGFQQDLRQDGHSARFLLSRQAEAMITGHFRAKPSLPASFFRKAGDGASSLRRAARIPVHAWQMWRCLRPELESACNCDFVFVPTVMAPHLLAWAWLVRTGRLPPGARLLLFFPNLPLRYTQTGGAEIDGSPTSKILRRVLGALAHEVRARRVILGVETHAMLKAASTVFGVPFTYLPHPVSPRGEVVAAARAGNGLLLGAYGPARHEKGSDILVQAIDRHLTEFPESRLRFAVQWVEDFPLPNGQNACVPARLRQHPRVEIIDRIFHPGEYASRLAETDALLLPYRLSSYGLRVSRVAIEGIVHGKILLTTAGTTLADQANEFGARITAGDGNADDMLRGIIKLERRHDELRAMATVRMPAAREHFSVSNFRSLLLAGYSMPRPPTAL